MKKILMILCFSLVISLVGLTAQEVAASPVPASDSQATVFERWPSSLGFYGHIHNGVGLSWQHWFDRFGLSVSAGGIYNPDSTETGPVLDYNVQALLSYAVFQEDFADWFSGNLQLGVYLAHRGLTAREYIAPEDPLNPSGDYYTVVPFVPSVHCGIDISLEAVLFGHFSVVADFMYVVSIPFELGFTPGFAFRYRY